MNKYDPTVGEIRGKLIFMPQGTILQGHGIPYEEKGNAYLEIQDNYRVTTYWALYGKWELVKGHMELANVNVGNGKIYINYLSGCGGTFPYFIASGRTTPSTNSKRLMTGAVDKVIFRKDKWPDFPRHNFIFFGWAGRRTEI